jgi:hypothetical protein
MTEEHEKIVMISPHREIKGYRANARTPGLLPVFMIEREEY